MRSTHSMLLKVMIFAGVCTTSGCSSTPAPQCNQALQDESEGNAGCLIVRGNDVLMVQQSLTGNWSIPGGTAEEGERSVCTAARETYEETGLKVKVVKKINLLDKRFHLYHCVEEELMLNQTPSINELIPVDTIEIRSAQWQSPQQRENLDWRFPDQKKLINQLVDQLNDAH
ncbi:MAG: NUDIX hydrolase [Ketobacter sp.]|nr:MAG: NUDIX hydrolase [Ketobacter sp.]